MQAHCRDSRAKADEGAELVAQQAAGAVAAATAARSGVQLVSEELATYQTGLEQEVAGVREDYASLQSFMASMTERTLAAEARQRQVRCIPCRKPVGSELNCRAS